jgi:hypothetical protein
MHFFFIFVCSCCLNFFGGDYLATLKLSEFELPDSKEFVDEIEEKISPDVQSFSSACIGIFLAYLVIRSFRVN